MYTVMPATSEADRAAVFAVRTEVFVREQGVPYDLEMDEFDDKAEHFVALRDGRAVGAGRLIVTGGVGVLGRLAVLPDDRGTGLGAALVRAIEEHALGLGLGTVELHAQTHALGFYRRLGYAEYGDEEMDAGIPHIWMRKRLN